MTTETIKTLKARILEELSELSEDKNGDFETTHSKADDLLVEFLKRLGHTDIVEAYEKVGKWYA